MRGRVRSICTLFVALLGFASAQAESTPWTSLPADLASLLSAKAEAYREAATGFSCRKQIRKVKFSGGTARKGKKRTYDYLFIEKESGRQLIARHFKPGSRSGNGRKSRPSLPEPLLWTQLFDKATASTLKYRIGQPLREDGQLVLPIEWRSFLPFDKGRNIGEWSGTIFLQQSSGNPIRLEATPNFQSELIEAQRERYNQAMQFSIVPFYSRKLAPYPDMREVKVLFGDVHEGLAFPALVTLRMFRKTGRKENDRRLLKAYEIRYDAYRFFRTHSSVVDEKPVRPRLHP